MPTYRRRSRSEDPTSTLSIQREYARKLRGRFSDINTEIRAGVRDRDVLGLREEQLADYDADNLRDFSFQRDATKERHFLAWLNRQQENGVLSVIGVNDNQYVRRAYESGIGTANSDLKGGGVDLGTDDLSSISRQPVHQDKLELLYSRNYQQLDGITNAVSQEVSRVLTNSLSAGVNPRVAADRLTDRVDSIGKTRATTLARTEILNAHNEAALSRFEQVLGPDAEIAIEAEILTAGDRRVCGICEPRHGETMTIREARDDGPPFHPNCRCTYRSRFTS